MSQEAHLSIFDQIARPVIFELADNDFPYWGKGTSILLANSRCYYWATAAHVLRNLGGTADKLRIFPSDESRVSLPFNEQYSVKLDEVNDEEFKDVLVLRIDVDEFDAAGDAPLAAQDLEEGLHYTEDLQKGDELWIIGYAAENNYIDYERESIKSTRSVIRAIYAGRSASDHCHTLNVESSIRLDSFDGLSGSPVFFMKNSLLEGQQVQIPLLVGMLLRGTASSKIAHFVSSRIFAELTRIAERTT